MTIASSPGGASVDERSPRAVHLFEFMDHERVPASIRATLREILECGNARPFRSYYQWVASRASRAARERGCTAIVELGAGSAPLTRHLAAAGDAHGIRLVPCDLHPDRTGYAELEARFPGVVAPEYGGVDYSHSRSWGGNACCS